MVIGRAGLAPRLVARTAELSQLAGVIDATHPARVALVGGEAGVGKTRLVQELLAEAGVPSIVGVAAPGSLGRPFSVLLSAVEPLVRRWDGLPVELEGRADAVRHLLAPVAPGLSPGDGERPAAEELVRAAGDVVAALVGDRRLLVVLEDLHWADGESLEVFDRLALLEGPVSLIGTYRPEELGSRHPAADVLARTERRQPVVHLRLAPFDRDAVAQFVEAVTGGAIDHRTVSVLTHRTGGNPFFLEALLAARPDCDCEDLATAALPWNLAETLRPVLDGLSEEARCVAEAASVMPTGLEFDLLGAVTALDERALIGALRELVDRAVLVERETDRFVWRHDLLRETVAAGLLGRERRRLHERAHDALVATDSDDWAARAHHAEGAARYDDAVAAALTGARQYLHRGASHQALQLAELGLAEQPDHLELLELAARSAWLVGLHDEAVDHARRLERRATDPDTRSAALRLLVRLSWERGDTNDEARAVAALVDQIDALAAGEERVRALAAVAQHHMLASRVDDALAWTARALADADALGSPAARAAVLVEHGSALLVGEDVDAGSRALLDAVELAEQVGDHVVAVRALTNLVGLPGTLDIDDRRAVVERLRRHAEQAGFDTFVTTVYRTKLAELAIDEGDLLEAHAHLSQLRGHLTIPNDDLLRVVVHMEVGDVAAAGELAASLDREPTAGCATHSVLLAWVAARQGDRSTATARLADLDVRPFGVHEVRGVLAYAWRDLVHVGVPVDVLDRAVRAVAQEGELWMPLTLATRGWLAEASGQVDEARTLLAEALRRSDPDRPVLPPHLQAEAHLALARLAALADRTAARAHVDAAVTLLDRWPGPRRDDAVALARRLSPDTDARRAVGPDLTNREREVALLVAEGLTNGQIADRLVISTKTASVHVSNMLAKLGLANRTELASWVTREGVGVQG